MRNLLFVVTIVCSLLCFRVIHAEDVVGKNAKLMWIVENVASSSDQRLPHINYMTELPIADAQTKSALYSVTKILDNLVRTKCMKSPNPVDERKCSDNTRKELKYAHFKRQYAAIVGKKVECRMVGDYNIGDLLKPVKTHHTSYGLCRYTNE